MPTPPNQLQQQVHLTEQTYAGYETTSTALSYTLYALARNPEVYRKLLEEVDTFGRDKVPSFDDLSQFKWIEACFLEAMRMYPIITPLWALVSQLLCALAQHPACL